jgi:hypothetical protein
MLVVKTSEVGVTLSPVKLALALLKFGTTFKNYTLFRKKILMRRRNHEICTYFAVYYR